MTNLKKISVRQLCFIIIPLFSVCKFYVLPALVSGVSLEGGWTAVLLSFIFDFIILLASVFTIKNLEKPLYNSSVEIFGKTLTNITFILYAVYFFLKAFIPLVEQKNTISLTFYESQPTLLIFMPFFIVAFYIVKRGVTAFARSVEIIIWLFLFSMLIIFALSVPAGSYGALLPLFNSPRKILAGSYSILLWFGDPVYLLFLGSYLKSKEKLYKKTIISYAITAIITVFLVAVFYSIFSSVSERQYYAPIKMSKYSITLSNIGRLDYLGSVILSLVSVYAICMPLILCYDSINNVFSFKGDNVIIPFLVVSFEAVLIYFCQNEIFESIKFVQRYFVPVFIVFAYVLPLVYAFATLIHKRKKEKLNV